MSESYRAYVATLESELARLSEVAEEARKKGVDPSLRIECRFAKDLADLVEGLVGPKGVAESIRTLSSKLQREELAFKVAEEIVYGKFGHMESEAAAEQAIRTALAIFTEGTTAAPIQGVARVRIKSNSDRTRYLAVYFAGPIRSAGGTDQALTLVVGDFVRKLLGLDRYKPTEEEISRFIEELRIYERSAMRFQYHIPDEEVRKALEWLPVEVTGTESDPIEVSSFRNLPRIETNRVRGGALRVVNDGIVGRAQKVLSIVEKLGFQGWDWLRDLHGRSEKKAGGFMDEVIAGRPVFSFPSRQGGFRLRYGRARNTGLSAVGIHPATMLVLQGFLAGGTQLKMELPGKGGVAVPVDAIEAPVVLLEDGSVTKVSIENYADIKDRIARILFLGDILVSFGDFLYNNRQLAPSGYVEEWWVEDVREALAMKFNGDLARASSEIQVRENWLSELLTDASTHKPTFKEAVQLSVQLHVPLHPAFIFFWSSLTSIDQLRQLKKWIAESKVDCEEGLVRGINGDADSSVKRLLETLRLPHVLRDGNIVVEGETAEALAFCLGYGTSCDMDFSTSKSILDAVGLMSGVKIRDKAPTLVGARMGRPEKAKRREMKPLVHVLFPVGLSGGAQRDLVEAAKHQPTFIELAKKKCPQCRTYTSRVRCPVCGSETVFEKTCPRCGKPLREVECPACHVHAIQYQKQIVNFRELLESSCSQLNVSMPKLLKGVKGLTNESRVPEILEKGILRAKYNLSVYKDGTIRFDATNAPLTHFKSGEVGVSVQALKNLGYTHDVRGETLARDDQVCELKLQDVVIPAKAADYFVSVAKFVDELLTKVYDLVPCYNVKTPMDLVGHLVIGLAPHTCVGILGRIVGFTDLSLCYAHPIWHSAKRRDCDGDEDTLMLGLDTLIDFSREYLPAQIGGIMDAPLLLIPVVITKEVQRQAHDFDVAASYPIEFYRKTLEKTEARLASPIVDLVAHRLDTEGQFEGFGYTTSVSNVNMGNTESSYKRFTAMTEKLEHQLELADKIEAVDARKVALKVLTTHFIRDISGNLRAFSTQGFRCKSCNRKFRRLPLRGTCPSCGGQPTLTVYRGGIEKYLNAAGKLVEKYSLPNYYAQRIALVREEILALFDSKKPKQISLTDFS